jgi:3-hydroxyisobutyrate dehydrogenase
VKIAFLGTGIMGGPMARNLAAAGHDVTVWNRTQAKAEGLGARVAGTPEEAAAGAEVMITMLTDGPTVDHAVPELDPATLWIQMSTVGAADTDRFAARHPRYMDCPVLGSKPQAESGELLVLASGAERPEEVFAAIASRVLWLADAPGAGTRLKLCVNHWIINLVENVAETFALAEASGVDPALFLDAIRGRPMDSGYAHLKGEKILSGDFTPAFTLTVATKDIRLALDLALASGVELALAPAALGRHERAIELGHGDDDASAVWFACRPGHLAH